MANDPNSVVHIWQNQEIVGQIESSIKKNNPQCGYVNLYYLIPEKRGQGLGAALDEYATWRLAKLGCTRIELMVDCSNKPGIKFYLKQGWANKGPHPSYHGGILMEKVLN